jgi:hypothetical protein
VRPASFLGIPDGFGFLNAPGAYDDNDGAYHIVIGVNQTPDCAGAETYALMGFGAYTGGWSGAPTQDLSCASAAVITFKRARRDASRAFFCAVATISQTVSSDHVWKILRSALRSSAAR